MSPWPVIFIIGGVTLALRAGFIVGGRSAGAGRFDDLRRFVPVAALTALVVPALVPHDGEPLAARPLAAAAAILVATRQRNLLAPVVVGLCLFWAVGWLE